MIQMWDIPSDLIKTICYYKNWGLYKMKFLRCTFILIISTIHEELWRRPGYSRV